MRAYIPLLSLSKEKKFRVKIDIRHNFKDVARTIERGGKQAQFAAAVALTRSAQSAKAALQREMPKVFDRPTRYTLNAVYVERATKATMTAKVWLKDNYGTHKHYLMPQVYGGNRDLKRFEGLLVRNGFMYPNQRAVPAKDMKLDAYGNVSRGLIVLLLAQLQVATTPNSYDVSNKNSRASKRLAKQGITYFVSQPKKGIAYRDRYGGIASRRQHLPAGIWMRRNFAQGSSVKPLFLFVERTNYKARLPFFEIAGKAARDSFPEHFKREYANAIATAR